MKNTNRKILLADDEEGIRKILGISLEDMGYEVRTAGNGAEGFEIFKEYSPSIVLTDIKMPVMGGIELLQEIKKYHPDTEVIMITGHGDLDLAIQSLKHDATDFVTKPINDEVLEIALKRAEERISMRMKLREYTENLENLVEEKSRQVIEAEKMAAVGQTVAELSHAIKSIASGLKGGAFVLEKGMELDNKQYLTQGWEMLKGNMDKITKLSLDLLDYAKSARTDLRLCDPNVPLQEVGELMIHRAEQHSIRLDVSAAPDVEKIYLDEEALHRCLLNLTANAIEACMDENCKSNEKRVLLQSRKSGDGGVEYRVEDNGIGITPEIKEKIFRSFFTSKGNRGTGIGLMLTKKIVDEHQGDIRAESETGQGTAFIIRIPPGSRPAP
ncbi:MAG: response regulator [Desulfococcaceae bacterium]|jgi:signal transduction histidine kinase|nr:response regulator [Desulfococcaceae bacterium]